MKKKNAKILAVLMSALLVAAIIVAPIFAQGEEPTIVGYSPARVVDVDTTAITDLKTVVVSDDMEELAGDAYKITDVAGFDTLRELLNIYISFEGKTVYLANDVDFSEDNDFTAIGFDTTEAVNDIPLAAFDGTFDGLGHKVDNITATMADSNKDNAADFGGIALFGALRGATVKNLVIGDGCSFIYLADPHDHGCVAGIAFKTYNSSIDNCMNMADLTNESRFTGGMVGRWYGVGSITNCTNVGDLTGCQSVAGMVGYQQNANSTLEITNCRNMGDCTVSKKYGFDNPAMVGSNHSTAAMVGWSQSDLTIDGCINNGLIEGIDNVGGFVGEKTEGSLTIENSIDYGYCQINDAKEGGHNGALAADDAIYAWASLTPTVENCQVKRGETDPTLEDYEVVIGLRQPPATTGGTEATPVNTTAAGQTPETLATTVEGETTAAPTTATPTTATPTTATPTTATPTTATPTTATPTTAAPTTATPTTATPTTATPTTAAATTEAPAATTVGDGTIGADEGGCQSTVIGSVAVILLASGAAVTMFKKKED